VRALLERLEGALLLVLFAAMVLIAAYQILARNLFGTGIPWGDGFVKFAVLWVSLIGAMLASRGEDHIRIDALARLVAPRLRRHIRRVTAAFTCLVTGLFAWVSAEFVIGEYQYPMMAFGAVPSWVCALILPVGFALISLRYLGHTIAPPAEAMD
jgi:TRAP-type C4-dicarboxylate transport system permease small subunit